MIDKVSHRERDRRSVSDVMLHLPVREREGKWPKSTDKQTKSVVVDIFWLTCG